MSLWSYGFILQISGKMMDTFQNALHVFLTKLFPWDIVSCILCTRSVALSWSYLLIYVLFLGRVTYLHVRRVITTEEKQTRPISITCRSLRRQYSYGVWSGVVVLDTVQVICILRRARLSAMCLIWWAGLHLIPNRSAVFCVELGLELCV